MWKVMLYDVSLLVPAGRRVSMWVRVKPEVAVDEAGGWGRLVEVGEGNALTARERSAKVDESVGRRKCMVDCGIERIRK
jgi:hypothetical protein